MKKEDVVEIIPDGRIADYIDGKHRNDTPEEYVRQNIEKRLVLEHKYPRDQIKVEYPVKIGSSRRRADIVVFPKGQPGRNIWIWVSDGTKRKLRKARNFPSLRFRSGYSPHTSRGGRRGGAGFASGPLQYPISITNSIEARNFETQVKEKVEERLQRRIRTIFRRSYRL